MWIKNKFRCISAVPGNKKPLPAGFQGQETVHKKAIISVIQTISAIKCLMLHLLSPASLSMRKDDNVSRKRSGIALTEVRQYSYRRCLYLSKMTAIKRINPRATY